MVDNKLKKKGVAPNTRATNNQKTSTAPVRKSVAPQTKQGSPVDKQQNTSSRTSQEQARTKGKGNPNHNAQSNQPVIQQTNKSEPKAAVTTADYTKVRRDRTYDDRVELAQQKILESFLGKLLYKVDDNDNIIHDEKGNPIENLDVTDISFNGRNTYLQDNSIGRYRVDSDSDPRQKPELHGGKKLPKLMITEKQVENLGKSVENAMSAKWNTKNPILDSEMATLRTNFMAKGVSPYGITFALRVSRARNAITQISDLCDTDTEKLLGVFMRTGTNLLISGQTGSGKTELQKALVGYMDDSAKITLMEDTLDSHIKELYPTKDINSWKTSISDDANQPSYGFPELIKSGLRNNPDWLMISEVRGMEAKDLLAAALTGHSIMTTIHATGAEGIPSRLSNMLSESGNMDHDAIMNDIVSVLNLGLHMEMIIDRKTGRISRQVREIFEYTEYVGGKIIARPIFERKLSYDPETDEYSEQINKSRLSPTMVDKLTNMKEYHNIPTVYRDGEYEE